VEKALRAAYLWDEMKDRLNEPARNPFGRTAAAPLPGAYAGAGTAVYCCSTSRVSGLDPISTARIEEALRKSEG